MGCAPSRNAGLVAPGPDIAKHAQITAAGAPLTFEDPEVNVKRATGGEEREELEINKAYLQNGVQDDLRKPDQNNPDVKEAPSSAHSRDSGIEELDEEYSFVITEFSQPDKVNEIEANFEENESLELLIVGKACSRKLSPKDKERTEEINILNKLRQEGFVPRPPSRASGGLRFEIVPANQMNDGTVPALRKLPPLSLQKALTKKNSKSLTKEDIEEKLEKAEERRKQQEEEKLVKIAGKSRIEVMKSEQHAQELKDRHNSKMETNAKIRQEKLRELQTRMKNHREHVEKVRHRKELLESVPSLDGM